MAWERAQHSILLHVELQTQKVYLMSDPRHLDTICLFSNRVMSVIESISLSMTFKRCLRHPSLISLPWQRLWLEFVWTGLFPSDPVIRFGGECTTSWSGGARSNLRFRNLQTGRTELQIWWMTYFVRTALLSNCTKPSKEVPSEAVIKYLKPTSLGRILTYHKHVLAPKQMQTKYVKDSYN